MNDKTVYEFTVNGTLIKTPHEKLTAGDIIHLAIKQGASGVSESRKTTYSSCWIIPTGSSSPTTSSTFWSIRRSSRRSPVRLR